MTDRFQFKPRHAAIFLSVIAAISAPYVCGFLAGYNTIAPTLKPIHGIASLNVAHGKDLRQEAKFKTTGVVDPFTWCYWSGYCRGYETADVVKERMTAVN